MTLDCFTAVRNDERWTARHQKTSVIARSETKWSDEAIQGLTTLLRHPSAAKVLAGYTERLKHFEPVPKLWIATGFALAMTKF